MNFWGWVCDTIDSLSTPEDFIRHDELMVEYGIVDSPFVPEWGDAINYLDHMPIEKDVWYDGEFTGYYQYYRTDHSGQRWYEPEVYSFYSGYQRAVEPDDVVFGEVVEEYIPVYMRLQGNRY